jgi:hypothetical protein
MRETMSRSGSRDEREQANEAPELGRMVLPQGRSGGATSASDEAKEEQPRPCSDRRPAAEPRSLSVVGPEREQPTALIRSRDLVFVRNRGYRISSAEREMMTEIGKFRTIAVADLARHRYPNEAGKLRQDLLDLKAQKLIGQRRVMAGKGQEKLLVLVLTREGKHLVQQQYRAPRGQSFYAGLVKPREVAHDAAIYRMYHVEAAEIDRRGGSVKRIVLDYELKKNVYQPLAKARNLPPLEYAKRQAEVAAGNGLKIIDGKIMLPDLRIEYETAQGGLAKVDLELATEHYRGAQAAGKLKAGFKVYADRASASRLNALLTYGRSSVYDGPELTARILSL